MIVAMDFLVKFCFIISFVCSGGLDTHYVSFAFVVFAVHIQNQLIPVQPSGKNEKKSSYTVRTVFIQNPILLI